MLNPIFRGVKDNLNYTVLEDKKKMGEFSAQLLINKIKLLLKEKEEVRIIFASAPSQKDFFDQLIKSKEIDWSRVVGFNMDEYIGLPNDSDQWLKNYLEENLVNKVKFKAFHFIDGTKNSSQMMTFYTNLLTEKKIDICCLGIGENGHIAFNDPPVADFNDPKVIKKVALDKFSRQQQVNDGRFEKVEDVPTHALSLTISTLTSVATMICTVPGSSKRVAIQMVLNDNISTACPATILRKHQDSHLVLDKESYGAN